MSSVHPMLMQLVLRLESSDNFIGELPAVVRFGPGAQALSRQIDALSEGVRPLKVTRVDFKGEPRDGRLVVTGQVVLKVRDAAAPTRQFGLVAEFSERNGSPVLTALGPAVH